MPLAPEQDDRSLLLLQAAAELGAPEEQRAFLSAVCEGDPALLADLVSTLTLRTEIGSGSESAASEEPSLAAGDVIGDRFHVVRKLGEGGMAVVYEAVDQKLMERRALKFPKMGHGQRVPEEARSALRVTHDNICRTHEIHTAVVHAQPADFISMELIEGETLRSRSCRDVPQAEALDIARQLCRGLDAAHGAQILHQDLKGNNVMLARRDGGGLRVVIMDFGLARPLGSKGRAASSNVGGTPNYIAPERWKGVPATPASDIYALGVILYEMLAGRLPFAKDTPWTERLNNLPAPPSRSVRKPDGRWDRIVLGCLAPDPAARTASADAVLRAVDRAFGGHSWRKWLVAAGLVAAALTPVALFRENIWPPPLVSLAVLPFDGSSGDAAVDQAVTGALYDLGKRLKQLGSASRRLTVMPLDDTMRYKVTSAAMAASRLGATHGLSGTIGAGPGGFTIDARITDAQTGVTVRHLSAPFRESDLAAVPASLAGVVTSAFHMAKAPPEGTCRQGYPQYAAGLASLRAIPPDLEKAVASFQQSVGVEDGCVPALNGLAEGLLAKYRQKPDAAGLVQAKTAVARAQSLQPDSFAVLLNLGLIEKYEGRQEHAIELYRRATELDPGNSDAWRLTGIAFQAIGSDTEAVEALRRAVQLADKYYAPHRDLGVIYYRIGRPAEAAEQFRTVTQLAPGLAEGFAYLGAALVALERDGEAESALRKAVELQPGRTSLNNLGVLLRLEGRDQEAVVVLEQALQAGADDAALRLNLGNALRHAGRLDDARNHFKQAGELSRAALQRNPRDAAARARLALSMARLGDRQAAEQALEAAKLAPTDYSVLLWAVMTLDSLGRPQDALALLSGASYDRLRDLRRQPDLADLVRNTGFLALMQQAQPTSTRRTADVQKN